MKYLVYLLLFIPFSTINMVAQTNSMNARTVIEEIQENVTCDWSETTVDNLKSGTVDSPVTGIATTFLANMDVLQRAKAKGLNMVITHEPTFYNHFDEREAYEQDPVYRAKLKYIEENDMVIWRFHDHWHKTNPDGIYKGIIAKLKWQEFREEKDRFVIPEITLGDLAAYLRDVFQAEGIRVVGDPDLSVSEVAMRLGASSYLGHFDMLKRSDVDVLLIGECREWETVEYVRDANGLGLNKGLILLGHAISEEEGMAYCAEWLSQFIEGVPVEFVPCKEPFWTPRRE